MSGLLATKVKPATEWPAMPDSFTKMIGLIRNELDEAGLDYMVGYQVLFGKVSRYLFHVNKVNLGWIACTVGLNTNSSDLVRIFLWKPDNIMAMYDITVPADPELWDDGHKAMYEELITRIAKRCNGTT